MIREIYDFSKKYITEAKDKKDVDFEAPFLVTDEVNKNNRLYPLEVFQRAINTFNSKAQEGKAWGGDQHPISGHLETKNVSHRITKIELKDKTAWITGKILADTAEGSKILSMIKSGGTVGISARGFGEIKKGKDGVNKIQNGYQLAGVDFVINPSVDIAQVSQKNIYESAPIEKEEKFNVSIVEFNNLVNKTIEHEFLISFPDANFLEEPVKKAYEKYMDDNWATYAEIIEKQLRPLKVEKTEIEKKTEETRGEVYTSEEQAYDEALVAGYDKPFETFKKEVLPALSEKEDELRVEFDEYKKSGGLQNFKDFKKIKGE